MTTDSAGAVLSPFLLPYAAAFGPGNGEGILTEPLPRTALRKTEHRSGCSDAETRFSQPLPLATPALKTALTCCQDIKPVLLGPRAQIRRQPCSVTSPERSTVRSEGDVPADSTRTGPRKASEQATFTHGSPKFGQTSENPYGLVGRGRLGGVRMRDAPSSSGHTSGGEGDAEAQGHIQHSRKGRGEFVSGCRVARTSAEPDKPLRDETATGTRRRETEPPFGSDWISTEVSRGSCRQPHSAGAAR